MEYIINDKKIIRKSEYKELISSFSPTYVAIKNSHRNMRMTRFNEKLSIYHIRVRDCNSYGTLIGTIKNDNILVSLEIKYEDGRRRCLSSIQTKGEEISLCQTECGKKFMEYVNKYSKYLPNDSSCLNEAEYHKKVPLWVSNEWRAGR